MCSNALYGKFLTIPKPYQHFGYFCGMGVFKRLFDFYIDSSIHVSLAVVSLTCISIIELGLPYNKELTGFVFFATITGYNFVKYFGIAKFHHRQLAKWLKVIQILSFVCFLTMCFYAFRLEYNTLVFIAILGLFTFLYAIPFLPNKSLSLRKVSRLKVYVIAFVWAGVTVLIPAINIDSPITADLIIVFLQRFLFVLILILPFEIRDLKYDDTKLETIPQKLGIRNTQFLGWMLLLVFVGLDFLRTNITPEMHYARMLIATITAFFLLFSREDQSPYYCSFWVESIPIIWLLLLLLFFK